MKHSHNLYTRLLIVLFLLFLSESAYSQQNYSPYQKYDLKKGKIIYKVIGLNESTPTCLLEITFDNYGASEVFKGDCLGNLYATLQKTDSIQSNQFQDGTVVKSQRKTDFICEIFIQDTAHILYQGLFLAKPLKKRYLKRKCQAYLHFEFQNTNDVRGTIIYYKKIPLYIYFYDAMNQQKIIFEAIELTEM